MQNVPHYAQVISQHDNLSHTIQKLPYTTLKLLHTTLKLPHTPQTKCFKHKLPNTTHTDCLMKCGLHGLVWLKCRVQYQLYQVYVNLATCVILDDAWLQNLHFVHRCLMQSSIVLVQRKKIERLISSLEDVTAKHREELLGNRRLQEDLSDASASILVMSRPSHKADNG